MITKHLHDLNPVHNIAWLQPSLQHCLSYIGSALPFKCPTLSAIMPSSVPSMHVMLLPKSGCEDSRQHESTRPSCTEARVMMEFGKQYAQIGHNFLLAQVEGTADLFIWTTSNRNRRREFCMMARCFHCGKTRKGAEDPKCWQIMSHPDLLMVSGDAALLLLANVALQARQKSAANCRLRM